MRRPTSPIYRRFTSGRDLAEDFKDRSGIELDEDQLNQTHQIVIVAAELDDSTERITRYLSERGVPINVLFFRVFKNGNEKLLSRAWLMAAIQDYLTHHMQTRSRSCGAPPSMPSSTRSASVRSFLGHTSSVLRCSVRISLSASSDI